MSPVELSDPQGEGEVLLYMGYQVCAAPKGMVFQPIWPLIGYGFCSLVLNWICFLEEATLSSLSIRPSAKVLHK